ncbi:MAG: MMPL family transporter, partial [Proteobacteria bacterium]|nr:MMPL family transporter [Pseudomonadota bacterium]
MLQGISRFCSRYSWLVIVVVVVVTVVFVRQLREKSYFEADMTKFLPPDMSAVKSDDYYKKNFNYQDMLLIAVEKRSGSIMEPSVLRAIEKISLDIKRLKASKTFQSRLMGKTVTLNQPVGMDPDSINSVAVLEDAILDRRTDSVVSGSVVEKLKSDNGIASAPGREERLPESDEDLRKIIPALQSRVLDDKTFRGSLLSEDLKAATIRAAMVRRWSYKKRYAEIEITTAIDGKRLKDRFSGKDSTFPFEIYGKTLDGISIDDEYIRRHSTQMRKRLHQWLVDYFEDTFEAEPVLKDLLAGEFTEERFLAVLKYQQRKDFYLVSDIGTWSNFINDLYSFTLERIDPFSRENLEFQLHDVENIYSLAEVYYLIQDVLAEHSVPGVKYYIAGAPLVFGVVADMMPKDMGTMVPIALAIILAVLLVSFRSLRGIVIPTVTVVLAVIWSLGLMASLGIPFTVTTNILPIVLLAVGSAYSIHLLNRFYEDAANVDNGGDRRKIVVTSVSKVGVAVFMAGVTTIAGFSSLATADLTPIKHFGAFSAVGVAVALLLTLTLTPAILTIWKAPKNRNLKVHGNPREKTDWVSRLMRRWANLVIAYPKIIVFSLTILVVASLSLMSRN